MKSSALILAACLTVGISNAGWAQDLKATEKFTKTKIGFVSGGAYRDYTLTITGPNGFHASATAKSGAPSIDLRRIGSVVDGAYSYQLTAASDDKVRLKKGNEGGSVGTILKNVSTSGRFDIKSGSIVAHELAHGTAKRKK